MRRTGGSDLRIELLGDRQSDIKQSPAMDVFRTMWKKFRKILQRRKKDNERERKDNRNSEKLEIELVKDVKNIIDTDEKIYHEMDFTLKNPIIFCNNGNILVRSKFAQKPPLCPAASKASRARKSKSWGFEAVRNLVERERPGNMEQSLTSQHDIGLITRSAHSTPKFEKKIKAFKSESLQFFGLKPSSTTSTPPLPGEESMFLDFSKNIRSRRKTGGNMNKKTCTL